MAKFAYPAVKAARLDSDLSQQDLADLLGIDRARVSNYETGTISPSATRLAQIADVLGVKPESLLEGAEILTS